MRYLTGCQGCGTRQQGGVRGHLRDFSRTGRKWRLEAQGTAAAMATTRAMRHPPGTKHRTQGGAWTWGGACWGPLRGDPGGKVWKRPLDTTAASWGQSGPLCPPGDRWGGAVVMHTSPGRGLLPRGFLGPLAASQPSGLAQGLHFPPTIPFPWAQSSQLPTLFLAANLPSAGQALNHFSGCLWPHALRLQRRTAWFSS